MTNPVGRPRLIESPEKFDSLVNGYLDMCREAKEPILLTGLVLALGLSSKDSFYDYQKFPEFSDSVKRARLLIEMEYEKRLNINSSPTGSIFALKNFGWVDRVEVDNKSTDGTMTPKPAVTLDKQDITNILTKINEGL